MNKEEVIQHIKECGEPEFYDIFDAVRERHNKKMLQED